MSSSCTSGATRSAAFLAVAGIVAVGAVIGWPEPDAGRVQPPPAAAGGSSQDHTRDGSTHPGQGSVVLTEDGTVDVTATAAAASSVDAGGLYPGLSAALERARAAASAEGIELPVNSGYRSADAQARLLFKEHTERGSLDEALRWVFAPDRSMHVRGLAIDVNAGPGADWLQRRGDGFGLCQTLAWEWWHFEWRQLWEVEGECPRPVDGPADAPPA